MSRTVTLSGKPVEVEGPVLKVGDKAPDFRLHQMGPDGLRDVTLADFSGKTLILATMLSVSTGICEAEAKRFNEIATHLPESFKVLTVTTDLPFTQGKFCGSLGLNAIETASDHRDVSFANAYGVYVPVIRALARSAFVISADGTIRYAEYCPEIAQEPNYDAVLAAAQQTATT